MPGLPHRGHSGHPHLFLKAAARTTRGMENPLSSILTPQRLFASLVPHLLLPASLLTL